MNYLYQIHINKITKVKPVIFWFLFIFFVFAILVTPQNSLASPYGTSNYNSEEYGQSGSSQSSSRRASPLASPNPSPTETPQTVDNPSSSVSTAEDSSFPTDLSTPTTSIAPQPNSNTLNQPPTPTYTPTQTRKPETNNSSSNSYRILTVIGIVALSGSAIIYTSILVRRKRR